MGAVQVMCVDDNERVLSALLLHFAGTMGFEVVRSLSSATGLAAAVRDTQPDILVLDLDIPGQNPLRELRKLTHSGAGTRTIVFSGYVGPALVAEAMNAGAWGYVSKGDSEDSLVEAIRAVVAGEIAWSPKVQSVIAPQ